MISSDSSLDWEKERLPRYKNYGPDFYSRGRAIMHMILAQFVFAIPMIYLTRWARVFGRKNIPPRNQHFILAVHHITLADPPLMSVILRRPIAYMAKKELYKHPFIAEFLYLVGSFAVDRDKPDRSTITSALNALRSGYWNLCIFPEGTRSKDGTVLPLKRGIGSFARKTNMPILPVGMYKGKFGRFTITIGKLIEDVSDEDKLQAELYDALVHLSSPDWDRKKDPDYH